MASLSIFDRNFGAFLASQIRFENLEGEKTASRIDKEALIFLSHLIKRPLVMGNPPFLHLCNKTIEHLKESSSERTPTTHSFIKTTTATQALVKAILIESNGRDGSDGVPGSSYSFDGRDGLGGEDGESGNDGEDIHIHLKREAGLIRIEYAKEIITWNAEDSSYSLLIRANGGKGGNGGTGGNGAKGKNGDDGEDATQFSDSTRGKEGHRGGNGGNGGNGGHGGEGGNITITLAKENVDLISFIGEVSCKGGDEGNGGLPGNGGKGGDGGQGGASYSWTEIKTKTEYYYDSHYKTQRSRLITESIPRYRGASSSGDEGSEGADGFDGNLGRRGKEGTLTILVDGVEYYDLESLKNLNERA